MVNIELCCQYVCLCCCFLVFLMDFIRFKVSLAMDGRDWEWEPSLLVLVQLSLCKARAGGVVLVMWFGGRSVMSGVMSVSVLPCFWNGHLGEGTNVCKKWASLSLSDKWSCNWVTTLRNKNNSSSIHCLYTWNYMNWYIINWGWPVLNLRGYAC